MQDLLKSLHEMEMATPNYQLLKMYIDAIPNFDGTPSLLNDFIEAYDGLILSYQNNNEEQSRFLFRTIKNKLKGQAQINISTRLEIQTWAEIIQILIRTFGDPRDIDTIQQDLIYLNFNPKIETLTNFSNRILQSQSL